MIEDRPPLFLLETVQGSHFSLVQKMAASDEDIEKKGVTAVEPTGDRVVPGYEDVAVGTSEFSPLKRSLQGRHMQMIAIGMCFFD